MFGKVQNRPYSVDSFDDVFLYGKGHLSSLSRGVEVFDFAHTRPPTLLPSSASVPCPHTNALRIFPFPRSDCHHALDQYRLRHSISFVDSSVRRTPTWYLSIETELEEIIVFLCIMQWFNNDNVKLLLKPSKQAQASRKDLSVNVNPPKVLSAGVVPKPGCGWKLWGLLTGMLVNSLSN